MRENRLIRTSMIMVAIILTVATGFCQDENAGAIPPEVADSAQDWPLPNKD